MPSEPAKRDGPRLSLMFPNAEAALDFAFEAAGMMRAARGSGGPIPMPTLEGLATTYGGQSRRGSVFTASSSKKEQRAYGYQPYITERDRKHLNERDTTAWMITTQVPQDTWFRLPRTYVDSLDRYFDLLSELGLPRAGTAGDIEQRVFGGAFLYINAGGEPDQPIGPGDVLHGFDYIPFESVSEPDIVTVQGAPSDPLLSHGFEFIGYRLPGGTVQRIHGSRIYPLCEDPRSKWWRAFSKLDVVFDALNNLRDVEFAQKHAQVQGNPIVMDIDYKAGYSADDDASDEMQEQAREFRSGQRDTFTAVEGIVMRRLGATDLDDAETILRLEAGRISHATEFTVNQILSGGKTSQGAGEDDYYIYENNIMRRRETLVRPILSHLVRLGKLIGEVPKRAVLPSELEWAALRIPKLRDQSFIDYRDAAAIREAARAGRSPPTRIDRRFPKLDEPINPDLVLPNPPVAQQPEEQDTEELAERIAEHLAQQKS